MQREDFTEFGKYRMMASTLSPISTIQLSPGLFTHMTEQQLTELIQKLWVQATASCGSATPQIVAEIRELERQLKELHD
jgi:hypothetical protein